MLKKVIEEAFPTVLAFTMSGMYSIADGIFVGKAAGDTGLAARKCFVLSLQRAGRAEGM